MNTRFEKSVRSSDEWYTPKEGLKALGRFDLDPCAPVHPLWPTAEVMYDRDMDGLSLDVYKRQILRRTTTAS